MYRATSSRELYSPLYFTGDEVGSCGGAVGFAESSISAAVPISVGSVVCNTSDIAAVGVSGRKTSSDTVQAAMPAMLKTTSKNAAMRLKILKSACFNMICLLVRKKVKPKGIYAKNFARRQPSSGAVSDPLRICFERSEYGYMIMPNEKFFNTVRVIIG